MTQKSFLKFFLLILIFPFCSCAPHSEQAKPQWDKKYDGYRFSPFASEEEDREAFRRMFPQGTPRAYVEHILIDKAGARIGTDSVNTSNDIPYKFVRYEEPFVLLRVEKRSPAHIFYYDLNDRVLQIKPYLNRDLYEQPRSHCVLNKHPMFKCK